MTRKLSVALAILAFLVFGLNVALADTASASVIQAEAMLQEGRNNSALAMLNAYLAKNPTDARALADRGDAYQNLSKYPPPSSTTRALLRRIRNSLMHTPQGASPTRISICMLQHWPIAIGLSN